MEVPHQLFNHQLTIVLQSVYQLHSALELIKEEGKVNEEQLKAAKRLLGALLRTQRTHAGLLLSVSTLNLWQRQLIESFVHTVTQEGLKLHQLVLEKQATVQLLGLTDRGDATMAMMKALHSQLWSEQEVE